VDGYRGGQASIRSGGDVPDWDNTESERHEDAAWRDLVARFDAPLTAQEPVPWPAREDMPPETDGGSEPDGAHGSDGKHRGPGADGLDGEPGRHSTDGEQGRHAADGRHAAGGDRGPGGLNGRHELDGSDHELGHEPGDEPGGISGGATGRHGRLGADGAHDPDVVQVPRRIRGPAARGVPANGTPADDEEHFIPPTPPPLPKLDPVTKGAWAALFGGPIYLVVATAAGWQVSGLAAFCAVAAFVAGFALLVLRMHEPGPGGPDDGDDGAVV
jgi:hypothetical protein